MSDNAPAMESRAPALVAVARQPVIGILTLVVVIVIGLLLSFVPGLVHATAVLGPITTIWLPFLVMNAVWWRGWPAAGLAQPWGGVVNVVMQTILAFLALFLAQSLVGGSVNFNEMFGPPYKMFPFLMPFAALTFGVMLHQTFVIGMWPYRVLEPRLAGIAAVVTSWVVGGILYITLCNWNPLPREALGAVPNPGGLFYAIDTTTVTLWVIAWQMIIGVTWGGWPFKLIKGTAASIISSTAACLVLGLVSAFVVRAITSGPAAIALAAASVFGAFVWGMAFETWPLQGPMGVGRAVPLAALAFVTAVVWYLLLNGLATSTTAFPQELPSQLYVGIASLNFFTANIVVYYAVLHRWPFTPPAPPPA